MIKTVCDLCEKEFKRDFVIFAPKKLPNEYTLSLPPAISPFALNIDVCLECLYKQKDRNPGDGA